MSSPSRLVDLAPDATRLVRDRVTWTLYGLYAVYGYFLYGFGPAVPLVRDEQLTSATVAGLHGTTLAAGAVVAGLLGGSAVNRWGRRTVLWASVAGMSAGVVLFCGPSVAALTLAGALVAGTFGSHVINSVSAALHDHHGPAAPAAITEANASGSGIGMVAPLVIGVAVSTGAGWRFGLLAVLPLCAVLVAFAWRVPIPEPQHLTAAVVHGDDAPHRLSGTFWWAWSVLVLCIALEFCLTIWCSELLEQRAGLSPGVAATGVTAIVAGLTLGRLAGSRFTRRRPAEWLLYRAIVVYLVGFSIFWTSTVGWLSFVGLFISGLGLALLYPLSVARAIAFSGGRPDLATARCSLGAGLAVGTGPFVLGALADGFGTHAAFLVVPVLAAAALLGIGLGGRAADG